MPGLDASSHSHNNFLVVQHDSAHDFLSATYPTLRRHEASANIILAHPLKRLPTETALTCQFATDADVQELLSAVDESSTTPHPPSPSPSFWLTLWSRASPTAPYTLDLVLSCIDWTLGEYPVFLWTPHLSKASSPVWAEARVDQLSRYLYDCVSAKRVFSVFGFTPLVKVFSKVWTSLTGNAVEPEPFYSAYFSFCNAATFRSSQAKLPEGHQLRWATMCDLEQVAQLCKEFADDSVSGMLGSCPKFKPSYIVADKRSTSYSQIFFPLTLDRARLEAQELISKRQIWVYDAEGDITTICAVTRNSHRVSAVTKVYTTPRWRRKGCAELLVRDVTAR